MSLKGDQHYPRIYLHKELRIIMFLIIYILEEKHALLVITLLLHGTCLIYMKQIAKRYTYQEGECVYIYIYIYILLLIFP